jgi:hypothetical protein
MLYTQPPARIDISLGNPFPGYSTYQLDMRRKAEILKYSNNKQSSKSNNLTKSQKWAQIALGNYSTLPQSYINTNIDNTISTTSALVLSCPSDNLILTPLSSCNVPPDGRTYYLYDDETVPLYNYVNPILTRSYGIINPPESTEPFTVIPIYNVVCKNYISTPFMSLLFLNAVDSNEYYADITVPLAIKISGNLINGNYMNLSNLSVNISDVSLNIYYNSEYVPQKNSFQYVFDNSMILFDLSINAIETGNAFSNTTYIGNLNINNVFLYYSPGYVYSMELQFGLTYSTEEIQNNATAYIYPSIITNVTFDSLYSDTKCIVHHLSDISGITPLTVVPSTL